MKPSNPAAPASPDALLVTTGSMRTLLPEVFYRHPQPSVVNEAAGDLRFIEVNDAWLQFFGLTREEVLGRPARDVGIWASPERREQFGEVVRTHQRLRDFETRARRHDGVEADLVLSWDRFEHGGHTCLLTVFSDITDRKQAERRLRESEQRFAAIVEHSPQAMTVTRLDDGVYLNVNHAFEDLTGYPRAAVIGRSSVELGIWPVAGVREELKRQFAAGQRVASIETQARARNGRLIDIFFSATVIGIDGQPALHGTVFDLTQIRQAVQARAISEERFAKIFRASPGPVVMTRRADGKYVEMNDAWVQQFGYQREESIGRTEVELGVWDSPVERGRMLEVLDRTGSVRGFETLFRRRSGERAGVVLSAEPIVVDGEDCLIICLTDVSAQRRADQRRALSEQRFSKVFGASPSPIAIINRASGAYTDINQAWLDLYGYALDEAIGRSATQLGVWVSPDDRLRMIKLGQTFGRVRGIEAQHRARSGALLDIITSMEPIELDVGPCWIVSVQDVTARHREERLRRSSEERFAKVFAASPSAILIIHSDTGSYADANQAWLDLYGYAREEVIGRTSAELNIWVDRAERERLIAQPSVRSVEVRHRNRAGEIIEVVESIEQIELDGHLARIVCAEDVTRQRRAERARAQLEERFGIVFQAGPHPIVIARAADGADMQVNQAWHDLLGYSAADIAGQTSASLNLWVEPGFRDQRQKMLARGEQVRNLETRMRTKSGATVDVLVSTELIGFDGEPYVLTMMTDITERRRADEQIQYLATRDQLTGLPNRLLFSDRLRLALTRAARDHSHLALLFIDLDHFKDINDTLGHQAGDHLLMEVAARLSAVVRGVDTLGRQGGDEFLLLLDGLADGAAAGPVAQKLVEALNAPFEYHGRAMKVSCSVGISIYPDDARTEEDLLRNADLAMYAAKESGRHDYRFYSPGMNQRLQERVALEEQLQGAVERDEFVLHYQPKVNFVSGLVTGCEALLRWHRPGRGLWQPGRFVAAAEDTRLIVPIGAWVLRHACATIRRWRDAGLVPVPVACNLSVHQFTAALPDQLAQVLHDTGVPGHLLQLEITETVMMTNASAHLDTMRRLKALGVQIALDDFGTGYSSLSYLRHMDLDVLKIDRSFVRELDSKSDAQVIVAAIISMARSFGLTTVAEGVESPEQAQALRRMHCDDYQGFLFSQPLPVEQFEAQYLQSAQG